MDNYKINYIFDSKNNINDIFIKVLKKEFDIYFEMICEKKINGSTDVSLSLKGDNNCF